MKTTKPRLPKPDDPAFIIAEAGVNHNGDVNLAFDLIDAAKDAGADAVKFQTFITDELVTRDAPKAAYQTTGSLPGETQYEMVKKLELNADDHRLIQARCRNIGIGFLSSPFTTGGVRLLAELGVEIIKVPSGEITNASLLRAVAALNRSTILSTGMATLGEVETAVGILEAGGVSDLALLHCTSSYPTPFADVHLRAMDTLRQAFGLPVGYSDHTVGIEVAVAAVARGAQIIEKHFTTDRTLPGPDHKASLEPCELKTMITSIRNVEMALGQARKQPTAAERDTAAVARKSLVTQVDIVAGTRLTADMIAIKRPGTGLPPDAMPYIIGRTAAHKLAAGTVIQLANLD